MSHNLTASDRTALIRLASSLPSGDNLRRAILASMSMVKTSAKLASEITGLEATILEFIVDSGQGFTASEISGELGVSLDKVQRSLSKIEDAGYIQSRAGSYFAVARKRLRDRAAALAAPLRSNPLR